MLLPSVDVYVQEITMMLNLALFVLATAASTGTPAPANRGLFLDRHRIEDGPAVEVWTNKDDDLLRRGDQVRVYFRASESGYVTVFRIDTDGRVRVIYPHDPWEDNYVRAGQRYEVRGYGDRESFIVDDYPGEGYVFAVASRDPFDYNNLVRGDHWDYRVIADGGRVTGDPYVAVTDLVDRIVPPNYNEYTYDVFPYFVQERHDYPRFLCYECHSYASYSYWNPYSYSCFRFRIVIYDDFYYYPNRRYGGARVVYRNSPRIAPRYVFKDRGPSEAFVTTVRERPVDQNGRRVADPGATVRDLGGSGRLPTPINNGRQRPGLSSDGNSGASSGSSTSQGTYGTGRRSEGQSQSSGSGSGSATSNDRGRTTPYERPGRQVESGSGQGSTTTNGSGRRGTEGIIPPAPGGSDRQQPTLERRDPRDTPGRRDDTGAQSQGSNDGAREQPQTQAEPRREPRRVPERQLEPQSQPESRQPESRQPESRQPERRAEPRSEPRQSPQSAPSRSSGGSSGSSGGSSRSSGSSSGSSSSGSSRSSGGESSSSGGSGRRTN